MKFAHMSDCHIGSWREETLREVNFRSFEMAIEISIENHVGFIIISGDLFDTALPSIDILKRAAKILSRLREYDIPVYVIPGSHDFSASGKTMLDVLENAGLIVNVMKFDDDNKLIFTADKTGVRLTGMHGRKGELEYSDYYNLDKTHLENESGFKIFLFHTLLEEAKQGEFKMMESPSISILPKNFDYYAGGHPHFVYTNYHKDYGIIAYPGPIFPNNFQEIEKLKHGNFFIVEANNGIKVNRIPLDIVESVSYYIDAENKTPKETENKILMAIKDYKNKIVTIRIDGCLKDGKTSDIDFKMINENLAGAYHVIRNTSKLTTKEFQRLENEEKDVPDIEISVVKEYSKDIFLNDEKILQIMKYLDTEKLEGERNADFESRVIREVSKFIDI